MSGKKYEQGNPPPPLEFRFVAESLSLGRGLAQPISNEPHTLHRLDVCLHRPVMLHDAAAQHGNQAGCAAESVCCGTECVSGACCGSFQKCSTEEQCCYEHDVMSCPDDGTGTKRCCGNEDEPCSLGANGRYHCCLGLSCIRDIFGNDYCRD